MTQPREFTRGTNWMPDRGKLYRFSDHGVVVIRPWPNPQAWVKHGIGPWRAARPCVDVGIACGVQTSLSAPVRNWAAEVAAWSQVPEDLRKATVRAHINDDQWSALSMLARCPGALELAQTVPFLAGMLSISHTFRPVSVQRPLRSIRALLKTPDGWRRWQAIAGWLGLDDSKAFIRMLRRVVVDPAIWWRRQDLDALLRAWAHPHGRKLLCHTPQITQDVVELLGAAQERQALSVLTHPLVQEVAAGGRRTLAGPMLSTTLMYWRFLPGPTLPPPIRSLEVLEAHRLACFEAVQDRAGFRRQPDEGGPLPDPPLTPVPGLKPLASSEDLIREGKELHHCIGNGTWARQARRYLGYGYAVQVANHRASIWIRRDRRRPCGFVLDQIRGHANGQPEEALVERVEQWIAQHDAWARYRSGDESRPTGEELMGPQAEGWTAALKALTSAEELGLYPDEIPF